MGGEMANGNICYQDLSIVGSVGINTAVTQCSQARKGLPLELIFATTERIMAFMNATT